MNFYDGKRFEYGKNQLVEVICQLRFPAILSINAKSPVDFQDAVRAAFPRYMMQPEKLKTQGGEETVKNHMFISENGKYKLSLTRDFIALSTLSYSSWGDFAGWLDEPLGNFISIYKPAFFERIGLRYVNGFSRSMLGLEDCLWSELIEPEYLGVVSRGDIDEKRLVRASQDVEYKLDERCTLKLHAGPGHVRRNIRTGDSVKAVQERETRFILDQDLSVSGDIKLCDAAETMETLHSHADRIFAEAVTDRLHEAMEPVYI